MAPIKDKDTKQGKQDEKRLAKMPSRNPNPLFQAHRLEGKVKNLGIKNIGRQQKRGKRGDR